MNTINSLNELIDLLKQSNAENYVSIAKDMCIPHNDFEKYAHWKEVGYARNCIIKTEAFELILICWNKSDTTPIHGHNDQKCWVYIIDGEMSETRYKEDSTGSLTECNKMQIKAGDLTYMENRMGYHSLKNSSEKKAMTLHLYCNPIESCDVFNVTENCFENKVLIFDSIGGEKISS